MQWWGFSFSFVTLSVEVDMARFIAYMYVARGNILLRSVTFRSRLSPGRYEQSTCLARVQIFAAVTQRQ